MTSISKNMCFHKLDDIMNKYNSTYNKTTKTKPDVKPRLYIDFDKKNNKEGPKCKIGNNVRI